PDELDCDFTSSEGDEGSKDSDVNTDGCTDCIHWEDHWGTECDRWDAGVCCPDCTGTIGDFVWFDGSEDFCNGIQDEDEMGIPGVEICLTKLGDSSFEVCTTTNGDGFYQFNGLCAGTYMVTVNPSTVPAGFDPTDFLQGGDGALDSDDPTETFVVLKFDDSTDPTIDFGYCLDCQECSGGITELTLRYLGISSPVDIEVFDKKSVSLFQGVASSGSDFTFSGMDKDGKMGTEISVFVDGFFNTKIHTSCSRPIGPGLVSGDFEVVGGTSLKGGPLCPVEPPDDDCGPCKGKVTQLTLMYTGDTEATIRVEQKKDAKIVFNDVVPAFGFFEFNGQDKNGTLGTEILVYVDDALSTKIHTSCSQPIGPGLVFGDFIVVEGSSLKGGPLCPFDTPPGDEDCGPCKGKVTELTLRYTGADAFVEVVQKKDNAVVYGAELDSGDAFTFSGQDKDGTLGTEIKVFVNSSLNATIHTSCSKPIGPGLVFGDFEVVAGQSKDGGPLCIGGDDDKKGGKKDKKKGGKKGRKKGGKK
ncbi:MAG: hypothetical protein IIC50_19020, partial [Planctomycetes bacterium]|nr:hypothetical protein [Planctomycetota bacterium]